ncbi:MAG TPA: hypothetical protein VGS58_21980 [Candidatus Sulfopaludibacter sp.]|nr:hypothetical protein [Candidatus Sulfopaludibacter sp.]
MLRKVAVMVIVGLPIGAAAALALTGLTRDFLFGVTRAEPGIFAVAAALLAAAAFAARRASVP